MSTENKKTSSSVSLQGIVYNVLNDMGIYNKDNYYRYLQFAIRGFTKLNMFSLESIEVAYLEMSDAGAVTIPPEFISYTKIGICKNGKVLILGLNNDICISRSESCGVALNTAFDVTEERFPSGYYFSPHFRGESYLPKLYGLSGGYSQSYYRVDRERGEIQFSSSVPNSTVILEYISSGVSLSGNTYIPRQAEEALIAFVHWKRVQYDPLVSQGEKRMAKADYYEEFNQLNSFEHMPTAQEIMDAFYTGWRATPNR